MPVISTRYYRRDTKRTGSAGAYAVGVALLLALTVPCSPSLAAVMISTDMTQSMTCSNGVCSPTASDAVLNVSDLENLLASSEITVTTTGSGVQADDIDLAGALSWSAGSRLSLDAYRSLTLASPVSVAGQGGLALSINDGGKDGLLSFVNGGSVTFQNLSSELAINGKNYVLVNSITSLATAISANLQGNYALGSAYDAGNDGTYSQSPIETFKGTFEGLGNAISNLSIASVETKTGLFGRLVNASVRHFGLVNATVSSSHGALNIGALAGEAEHSIIDQAYVSGTVSTNVRAYAGGLLGYTANNKISRSFSTADVSGSDGDVSVIGGLIGNSDVGDLITRCYALGNVSGRSAAVGGLIGQTSGTVMESYAIGSVSGQKSSSIGGLVGGNSGTLINVYANGSVSSRLIEGGLVGFNNTTIANAYSTGAVPESAQDRGGLIGYDNAAAGSLSRTYWDMTTSGINDPGQGAGNIANDPGIEGKTTKQLQSRLPKGFDPKIWGQDANINGGFPYLLNNPPPH